MLVGPPKPATKRLRKHLGGGGLIGGGGDCFGDPKTHPIKDLGSEEEVTLGGGFFASETPKITHRVDVGGR